MEMASIKQEFLENETNSDEFNITLIKEEPCSLDNLNESGANNAPELRQEIDTLNVIKLENITFDLVPKDIEFVKCEQGLVSFDWNVDEVDPLLLTQDQHLNNKKQSSSDITSALPNDKDEEIPISDDINTTGLNMQEESFKNMTKEEEYFRHGRKDYHVIYHIKVINILRNQNMSNNMLLHEPGFCPNCGSILPMLGEVGGVVCYVCENKYDAKVFGNMESEYVIHFNTYTGPTKKVVIEDAEGPVVERRCPKCNNDKMSYATLQLRSADEGQTVFYTCTKCKFKESENS